MIGAAETDNGGVNVDEGWLSTPAGQRIYFRRFEVKTPRAVLAIAHGFGEHGGRYPAVVERMGAEGYSVLAMDHRGHGRSPGPRGHVDRWSDYRDDVDAFVQMVGRENPEVPVFLMGHSMGALIVVDYVLHEAPALAGVIASGIGLRPGKAATRLQILMAQTLSSFLPRLPLKVGAIDGGRLTRDPDMLTTYREDPLVHNVATVRWGREALAAIERVRRMAGGMQVPILITHGEKDEVVQAEGSRELYERLEHADRELRIYPEALHEPHNDVCRGEVVEDLVRWVGRRCPEPTPKTPVGA